MCSPTTCRTCKRTTWRGCGAHVDQVMARVPADDRCRCIDDDRATGGGLLSRLLGR